MQLSVWGISAQMLFQNYGLALVTTDYLIGTPAPGPVSWAEQVCKGLGGSCALAVGGQIQLWGKKLSGK